MDDNTTQVLTDIAKAIEERSPVIFMPMVAEFLYDVASKIEERDAVIEKLQARLSEFL
jgi:hypothetical protein